MISNYSKVARQYEGGLKENCKMKNKSIPSDRSHSYPLSYSAFGSITLNMILMYDMTAQTNRTCIINQCSMHTRVGTATLLTSLNHYITLIR